MTVNLSPTPYQRFVDSNGASLSGGLLYTYVAGTSTPLATYTDSTGLTPNTNPIVLNTRGECSIWLDPTLTYKFVLQTSTGGSVWTQDNISPYVGVNYFQNAEVQVASATTTDIGSAASAFLQITGTTTITSFGVTYKGPKFIRFAAALTLTHNASTLILPGAANITTAAGDTCIAVPKATAGTSDGWEVLAYQRSAGIPAFSAWASGTTSLPAATVTKVAFATKEFDPTSAFDATTNYRFQPTVAGYYSLSAQYSTTAAAANSTSLIRCMLYKNGSLWSNRDALSSVNITVFGAITDLIFLNGSTDYVEVYAFQNTGASLTIASGEAITRFSGFLARPQ